MIIAYVFMIGVGIIGLAYLVTGNGKITRRKVVNADTGRLLGLIMLAGSLIDFAMRSGESFYYLSFLSLILSIVIGLILAKPITQPD